VQQMCTLLRKNCAEAHFILFTRVLARSHSTSPVRVFADSAVAVTSRDETLEK
jgi:hypothetical protein